MHFLHRSSNVSTRSYASSDLSSLFKSPVTVHFVRFLSLYAGNVLAGSVRRRGQERYDVTARRFFALLNALRRSGHRENRAPVFLCTVGVDGRRSVECENAQLFSPFAR
uniref:Uncharacterized protein n=1 Tax=Rhipicephalus zambeziensis TaxID=60191 RepID=A0A224YG07_9ACAR